MKSILLFLLVIVYMSQLNAQTTPMTYVCEPSYPVPEYLDYLDTLPPIDNYFDGGFFYDNGVKLWHRNEHDGTATVYDLENTTYSVVTLQGSGPNIWQTNVSQVFALNGILYFVDHRGITETGSLEYWMYPDSTMRHAPNVYVKDGVAWIGSRDAEFSRRWIKASVRRQPRTGGGAP